ncbi:MAG: transcription antitermination factor NusB [Chloroflexi bacterium]|nr:transcription antitermination factor NusB [Chloroflexota bacterium]
MAAGSRRRSRIIAFQAIYEADQSEHTLSAVLARLLDEAALAPEASAFVEQLVLGVDARREEIDAMIAERASAFPLTAMAPVDRNVLRLALFEICFDNHRAPLAVVINEAVELAKGYGSESSGRFVHGVLGAIAGRQQAQDEAGARTEVARSAAALTATAPPRAAE